MKRLGAVLSLTMIVIMLACPFAYAAGLTVTHITPTDGETGKQPLSMAVKVRFSENMTSKEAQKANEKYFKITDPEGKEQKYVTAYDAEKYPNEIWLILQNDLVSDTEYKITIDKGLASSNGDLLGTDFTSTFKTRNVQTDNNISMGMTVAMVVIMVFASSAAAKKMKKQQEVEAIVEKEEALNPYKIAKEKGISVEAAAAYIEKEKAKIEKKRKKNKASLDDEDEDDGDEDFDDGIYHVKRKRPISDAGVKTPESIVRKNKKRRAAKKAEEERKLAEMRARTAGKKKKK